MTTRQRLLPVFNDHGQRRIVGVNSADGRQFPLEEESQGGAASATLAEADEGSMSHFGVKRDINCQRHKSEARRVPLRAGFLRILPVLGNVPVCC